MSLQARTEFAKRHALLKRKVAGMCHRRVAHRRDVTVGEEKAITLFPIGILRIMFQDVKIECRKNVGHAQGPCRVARFCLGDHFYDRFSYIESSRFYLLNLFIRNSHTCTFDTTSRPVASAERCGTGVANALRSISFTSASVIDIYTLQ